MTKKQFFFLFLTFFAFSACNSVSSEEKAIREKARQNLTGTAEPTAPNNISAEPNTSTPAEFSAAKLNPDAKRVNKFNDNKVKVAGPTTKMQFKGKVFDYGTIKEGDKASHTYIFTNTGTEPLVISNAKGSCGCTVPSYSTDPVAPGETGKIDVVFNSKGKPGSQSKTVTLTANTEPIKTVLTIKGKVIPKKRSASIKK